MRTNYFIPTLLSVLLSGLLAAPAMGQGTGPVSFNVTEGALKGKVSCNGIADTPVASVDASETDGTGGSDSRASGLSGTACGGLPLYSTGSVNDSTSAQDTTSSDDGDGSSTMQNFSLLGGLVTYTSKTETDGCSIASGQTAISCQDQTTISGLYFAGQHITGTFSSPTAFHVNNASVSIPSCTGGATFTGDLTLADTSQDIDGATVTLHVMPIHLRGTLTCVASSTTTMMADLRDYYDQSNDSGDEEEYAVLVIDNG